MGVGPQKFHKTWNALFEFASFSKIFSRIDHNDVWLRQGAECSLFYYPGLLWYHVAHNLLYTNPVTLYYSENVHMEKS